MSTESVARSTFFTHLRRMTEIALGELKAKPHPQPGIDRLRVQSYYQMGWSQLEAMRTWLQEMRGVEREYGSSAAPGRSGWGVMRSLSIALAHLGEPDALDEFVTHGLSSDDGIAANLRCWTSWVGTAPTSDDDGDWLGGDLKVFSRLIENLADDNPTLSLDVRTLTTLLAEPGALAALHRAPRLTAHLAMASEQLMSANGTPGDVRASLEQIHHLARQV
jgi:hypothetical protein